jgi:hypothetical protein
LYLTLQDLPLARVMVKVKTPLRDPAFTETLTISLVPLS